MPFARKGEAGLTERLDVRVAPAEKEQLRRIAADAGLAVAELVRARALGSPRRVARGRHGNPRAASARRPPQEGSRRQRRRLQQGDGVCPRRASRGYRAASPVAARGRGDRQEGRHLEGRGAQE